MKVPKVQKNEERITVRLVGRDVVILYPRGDGLDSMMPVEEALKGYENYINDAYKKQKRKESRRKK